MQNKRGNKKSEAKSEELEFIYKRMDKVSDRVILDELEDELSIRRSLGFIKRRHVEFNAAKKALLGKLDDKYIRHMIMLSKTANTVANTLKNWRWNSLGVDVPAVNNSPMEISNFPQPESKWLFSHIKNQISVLKNIDDWESLNLADYSEELEELLKLCAERREFPGKCDVCQDWEKPEEFSSK